MPRRGRRPLRPRRIRARLTLTPLDKGPLRELLEHVLDRAGNPGLLTDGLKAVLVEHAAGNPRVLCQMGADLLGIAAERDHPHLDEQLFLEQFGRAAPARSKRAVNA